MRHYFEEIIRKSSRLSKTKLEDSVEFFKQFKNTDPESISFKSKNLLSIGKNRA